MVRSPEASLAFLALLANLLFVACFGGGSKPNCHRHNRRRAQRVGARRAKLGREHRKRFDRGD